MEEDVKGAAEEEKRKEGNGTKEEGIDGTDGTGDKERKIESAAQRVAKQGELREILVKMEREQETLKKKAGKQLFYSRISAVSLLVLAAAIVTAVCLLLPRAFQTLDAAEGMMEQIGTAAEDADQELETVDRLLIQVEGFVSESEDSLEKTMEKVNSMDIGSLNQAIRDLQTVVEPLAKMLRKFG